MKKNLLFGFLILFVLNTAAFAGLADSKRESEKPVVSNPRENKLSDEELSRLSRRAEIDNLDNSNFSNIEKNNLKKGIKATQQQDGRRHHGYYFVGGSGLLLIIILVILLA